MISTIRMGFRNLARSPGRTGLSLLAVSFGVVAVIMAGGFIEWAYWAMREAAIQSGLGHLQVSGAGFRDHGAADPYRHLLPEDDPRLAALRVNPEVRDVAPRLLFAGLASRGDATVSFIGEGVDPAAEEQVSRVLAVTAGQNLSPTAPDEVVLGQGLAAALGVGVGDTVVLLVRTPAGGMNGLELTVRGLITREIKAYDNAAVRMPLDTARRLTRVRGSHLWVVRLERTEQAGPVAERLRRPLADSGLELATWTELSAYYRSAVALFSRQLLVIELIIGTIIVLSMSNVLVMSVLERTGEIGTMMAMGNRRRDVVGLFMAEGLLLGLAGGILGAIAGVALSHAVSAVGIPMPPPPGRSAGYRAEILVTAGLVVEGVALALVCATAATAYPSWKAARLDIVDALRRNR